MAEKFHTLIQQLQAEYARLHAEKEHYERAARGPGAGGDNKRLLPGDTQELDGDGSPAGRLGDTMRTVRLDTGALDGPTCPLPGCVADLPTRPASTYNVWLEDSRQVEENLSNVYKKNAALQDIDAIKAKLKRDSQDSYALPVVPDKDAGWAARVARSRWFECFSLGVISANALWIWLDVDLNTPGEAGYEEFPDDFRWIFTFADNLFCAFFTVELAILWLSYGRKCNALRNGWFVFNCVLLVQMVFETWVLQILLAVDSGGDGLATMPLENLRIIRLIRLTRLFRLSRFMHIMPELLFMVKGIVKAARGVSITLAMLLGVLYVAGITIRQISAGTEMGERYFPTVHWAMLTLLLNGALLDNVAFVTFAILRESIVCALIFMFVILLAALTMMNMLVGVLCEVMSGVASAEKEKMASGFVRNKLNWVLYKSGLDENNDGHMSVEEFRLLLMHEEALQALLEVDVDPSDLIDFADYIFQSDEEGKAFDKEISLDSFVELVMKLRGNNFATVKDMVELRRLIQEENTKKNIQLSRIEERLRYAAEDRFRMEERLEQATCRNARLGTSWLGPSARQTGTTDTIIS